MPRSTRRARGALVDIASMGDRSPDPVAGVARLRGLRDAGKRRIEQFVPERCRVDHEKPFRIRVYSALQSQIHQNRPGKRMLKRQRGYADELPVLTIKQKQHELLCESQHTRNLPIQMEPELKETLAHPVDHFMAADLRWCKRRCSMAFRLILSLFSRMVWPPK